MSGALRAKLCAPLSDWSRRFVDAMLSPVELDKPNGLCPGHLCLALSSAKVFPDVTWTVESASTPLE